MVVTSEALDLKHSLINNIQYFFNQTTVVVTLG